MVRVRALGAVGISALVLTAFAAGPVAQAPGSPSFDAASVKPNRNRDAPVSLNLQPGGVLTATNTTLRQLIAFAYGEDGPPLPDFQIIGVPNWNDSDRFDVIGKSEGIASSGSVGPGPAVAQQVRLMMRALLTDRFKLVVHQELRELPIYLLVKAHPDGQLGPSLKTSEGDCAAALAARRNAPATSNGPFCGIRGGPGRLLLSVASIPTFAKILSRSVDRPIVDRTELVGNFDGSLEWTPDPTAIGSASGALPPPPSDGPSIFTALQEQLGLKLESSKGPVSVVVIDSVEHPTPD